MIGDEFLRERFSQYADHELVVAMGVLADWRNNAGTESAGDRWQELLLVAGEVKDQRAADLREFFDLVTPVAAILPDDDAAFGDPE